MVDKKEQRKLDEPESKTSEDIKPSGYPVKCGFSIMSKYRDKPSKPFTGERRPFFLPLDEKDKE